MRHWRKTSWAIAVWTALMVLWAFSALTNVSEIEATTEGAKAGIAIGATIGLAFIGGVWMAGLIPLSLLWFGTRPRS